MRSPTLHPNATALERFIRWVRKSEYEADYVEFTRGAADTFEVQTGIEIDEGFDMVGAQHATNFLIGLMEGFASESFENGEFLCDLYLEECAAKIHPANAAYLRALSRSVLSLYEVVDFVPKTSITVRDLLRGGRETFVPESKGSQSTFRGQRLLARVLDLGGRHCFSGGILPIQDEPAAAFEATIRDEVRLVLREQPKMLRNSALLRERATHEVLSGLCPAALSFWLASAVMLVCTRPALAVTGGEPLTFTSLRFPLVAGEPTHVAEALNAAPDFLAESSKAVWSWMPEGVESGKVIHAWFAIEANEVVASCFSRSRADRATARAQELFGMLVGPVERSESDISELDTSKLVGASDMADSTTELEQEEVAATIEALKIEHYLATLDQPVPMLGNKAPRALVRTGKGKQQVVDWLSTLERRENQASLTGMKPPFDFTFLWEELGLVDLRK